MADFIITGKKGSGKTLVAAGLIRDALNQGKRVATNIDINVEHCMSWKRKNITLFRLPDKLEAESFKIIGCGNDSYDEDRNGLVILDEGGLFLNSREYREAGRKEFIQWGIHSRKLGWDLYIVIQHLDGLDKQIRDFFGEHTVYCSNLSRIRIPFIGWLLQMFGFQAALPKSHKATCKYGQSATDPVTWRKWFKGADLYDAYDTRQKFNPDDASGVRSMLSPWHVKGRHVDQYQELRDYFNHVWRRYLNVRLGRLPVFFCAACLGGWAVASYNDKPQLTDPRLSMLGVTKIESEKTQVVQAELEPVVEADPWESAYINSAFIDLRNQKFVFWFKDSNGDPLKPANKWKVQGVSKCLAYVETPETKYTLRCRAG